MKQLLRFGLSATVAVTFSTLTACEQEQILTKQLVPDTVAISKAPYVEQVAYTHEHLGVLGQALLLLQKDERIRRLMYAEFDKCEPGFENVLFKTLIEKAKVEGIDLEGEMNQALAKVGINKTATNGLLAFKGIDGVTWQPQIYLPNYAALKEKGKIGRKEVSASPILYTYASEPETSTTTHETWQATGDGTILSKGANATEATLSNREVMIISLSERLSTGPLRSTPIIAAPVKGEKGSTTGQRPTGTKSYPQIRSMSVKKHREDVSAGATEVAIVATVSWYNFQRVNPFNPPPPDDGSYLVKVGYDSYDEGGGAVGDWTRNQVSNQTWREVMFRFINVWNPYWYPSPGSYDTGETYQGDTFSYVIYEADSWPTGIRTETFASSSPSTGGRIFFTYRSTDNPFIVGTVSADPNQPNNAQDGYSDPFNQYGRYYYKDHFPINTEIQFITD